MEINASNQMLTTAWRKQNLTFQPRKYGNRAEAAPYTLSLKVVDSLQKFHAIKLYLCAHTHWQLKKLSCHLSELSVWQADILFNVCIINSLTPSAPRAHRRHRESTIQTTYGLIRVCLFVCVCAYVSVAAYP